MSVAGATTQFSTVSLEVHMLCVVGAHGGVCTYPGQQRAQGWDKLRRRKPDLVPPPKSYLPGASKRTRGSLHVYVL